MEHLELFIACHNAKGQREAIWYGNGTKTGYTYDALSNRLRRLLTVNVDSASNHYNEILQDLNYYYDAAGNITTIRDDAQQTLFFDNKIIRPNQSYTYDSLYRLVRAEGREQISQATFGVEDNWNDSGWTGLTHKGDGGAIQPYIQKYSYDKAGNLTALQHIAGSGSFTRSFSMDAYSNHAYFYGVNVGGANTGGGALPKDARGNITSMPHLPAMKYDALNQMNCVATGTTEAFYQYSGGQRIRKYLKKNEMAEERIYLGSYEIYRKYGNTGSIALERTTVHVGDDTGRIAMLEVRTEGEDDSAESLQRYIYSNHLQSAALELNGGGGVIYYEEYHPYGTTSYQAMNADIRAVASQAVPVYG